MPIPVIINGATGKMGTLACETLEHEKNFEIVAKLRSTDNLGEALQKTKAQIVIDVTRADCVYENCLTIIQQGAHPIVGTSGLKPDQIQELNALCAAKKLGGIIAPNFSLGAILMMLFAAKAAEFFPEVEIVEAHHQQKLDAPSGTALKTAEMIGNARKKTKNKLLLKELLPGARGGSLFDVNIHSLRLPGVLAKQQVIFGNTGETLSIEHNSLDRQSFKPGILLACQKVQTLNTLIYGLENLL